MRTEDNREKYKEYDHRYYIKHKRPNSKIGKLETKISDLEAKLAESEKENDTLTAKLEQANEIINNPDTLIFQQQELIDNLQIIIKEKEKEIEQLKKFDDINKTFFDLFRTAFKEPDKVDDLFNILKTIQEKQDQDKISFVVDILEELADCSNYINSKLDFESGSYVSEKSIRDKIKYLKGKKDE